jgi:hypothetical protein
MFTSLIFLLLFTVFYYSNRNGIYFQAVAQATGSPDLAKVLVDNAIQALQGRDISKSILHTQAASQELLILESGYDVYSRTTIQALSKLLQKNVLQSIQNNDFHQALVFLNLADQQLGILINNNDNNKMPNANTSTSNFIPEGTFLTYTNPAYKIRIQYQYNWVIEGSSYPAGRGRALISSFYLPNINDGLPFFRIGVDNLTRGLPQSSVVNIDQYLNQSLKSKNATGFPGLKLIGYNITNNRLAGNIAYTIVWTYNHPTYGIRKSMEIGTVIGNKGYFIDYTAAEPKFPNYLSIIQKMIDSFTIIRESTTTTAISFGSHHT